MALEAGDVEGAKAHLLESAKTPGSPVLNSFGPELSLAKELLARGEREAVIQYLESLPRFWQGRQGAIDEWVILIRAGSTINFRAGETRANNAVINLGPGGDFVIHADLAAAGSVHVIVDVAGYLE